MSFRTFLFIPAVIGSKDTVKGKPFRKRHRFESVLVLLGSAKPGYFTCDGPPVLMFWETGN